MQEACSILESPDLLSNMLQVSFLSFCLACLSFLPFMGPSAQQRRHVGPLFSPSVIRSPLLAHYPSPLPAFQVHESFGVTEKVPRVGGRELDLYMLYRNVTSLGGCERVIQTKHWREAAESFNYPETITSVSFSLRKAYCTFLWDYEQVCFIHSDYDCCFTFLWDYDQE